MSLGYVKGRYWVTDEVFAEYAKRPSYTAFLVALRKAGLAIQCSYSYIARTYHAEIVTHERLQDSANLYLLKHNNAYDANPLAAMGRAAVESDKVTPLIRACVLVMETELLTDAYRAAVKREAEQARLEAKLDRAFTEFARAIKAFSLPTWDEVFSDMIKTEHGTYVDPAARPQGKPAPFVAFDEDDDL